MKVLYIAHSAEMQGAGFALLNMVQGVLRYKVVPYVFVPSEGTLTITLKKMGISFLVIPFYNAIYPRLNVTLRDIVLFVPRLLRILIYNKLAERKLYLFLKSNRMDIVHSNTGVIHFGAKVAARLSIPHVWLIREYQKLDFGYRALGGIDGLKKHLSNSNNHVIAITKGVFHYFKLKQNKDIVIYDGVFMDTDEIKIRMNKCNYLLFVGALIKGKGAFCALSAFEEIAKWDLNVELWFAGEGKKTFIDAVEKSPFKSRIKLLGFRTDIYELMSNAKALLVPSFFEGFGFIVVEAMLNGCIVIGRNEAGLKEQFDNGFQKTGQEIGLRFECQQELVNQIKYVCNTPFEDFLPMIKAAQNVILNYSVDQNVKQIMSFYKTILKLC